MPETFKNGLPISGMELMDYVKAETDTVILSFSNGKDSIAAWLAIRPHFNVIPVYMWSVPGLSFINKTLDMYEKVFGTHIIRMPHPSFMRKMNYNIFQPPQNTATIRAANLPLLSYDDIFTAVREEWNLPKSSWVATGVRAADSPNRRATINKYGPTSEERNPKVFYPVWDWTKDKLIHELKTHKIPLGVEYKLFNRSYDGLDLRFLWPIKHHYPEDYKRILEFFPLAELEIKRYEYHLNHMKEASHGLA